jgi:hypothetical protein
LAARRIERLKERLFMIEACRVDCCKGVLEADGKSNLKPAVMFYISGPS